MDATDVKVCSWNFKKCFPEECRISDSEVYWFLSWTAVWLSAPMLHVQLRGCAVLP